MFQSKEPVLQEKNASIARTRLSGKQITQESSQTSSVTRSSRLSSPSPSKSLTKTQPAISSKSTDTSAQAKASGLRTTSKPSIKPKPAAAAASRSSKPVSRLGAGRSQDGKSLSSRPVSRSGSGRSPDGKSLRSKPVSRSGSGRSLDGKSLSQSLDGKSLRSKPVSRSGSGRSLDGKSLSLDNKSLSQSLKPPLATAKLKTGPKVDMKESSQLKVMGGKSTTCKAGPSETLGSHKLDVDSRSPSPKHANGKLESPKTTRKLPTNVKSGIPSKSATRLSGNTLVPVKPRPPPKATSKPTNSRSTDLRSASLKSTDSRSSDLKSTNIKSTAEKSAIPKSKAVGKQNVASKEETSCNTETSSISQISPEQVENRSPEPLEVSGVPVCKASIDEQSQQETAHNESPCSQPVSVSVNQTGAEKSVYVDLVSTDESKVPEGPNGHTADDNIDDEIYDDVVHITELSKLPSVTVSSKYPHEKESNVEKDETTVLHAFSEPLTFEPAESESAPIIDNTAVNANSSTSTQIVVAQEVPPTDETVCDAKHSVDSQVDKRDVVHIATMELPDAKPDFGKAEPVVYTANEIYGDLATSSHVESVVLTTDDVYDDVVHSTGSMKTAAPNEVEDTGVPTADEIYDDVVQSSPAVVQVSHEVSSEGSQHAHSSDIMQPNQKQETGKKLSKSPSPQPQQIKETRLSISDMNYSNVYKMGHVSDDDDIEVIELTQSPRQSTVARFQRATDKDFTCRDSGLGIEAYYDKVVASDAAVEPVFYDEINNREQLKTISSTEDVVQTKSSTENVTPPPLPPRSDTLLEEGLNLARQSIVASPKLLEATTVESGFEDQWLEGQSTEDNGTSNQPAVEQEYLQDNSNFPPPLPPRRPRSSLASLDDKPLINKDVLQKSRSVSPQVPPLPPRAISSPSLQSAKELASSNSSLAPSQSAVSVLSSRSENVTDVGSDASRPNSFVESGGETPSSEHKKEKSKFSLGIFSRRKSDRRKKSTEKSAENNEESDQIRPRASSLGHSLARKKTSRQAMKKKGSVPPELEYCLPDPIHVVGDEEYDDCMVIQNKWKSPPAQEENTTTDAKITQVPLNDVGPDMKTVVEVPGSGLEKKREFIKSVESFGSFTQNFEDSSGWFDDIYDMVANSSVTDSAPTIAVNDGDEIYDAVAPDLLPNASNNSGLTVAVTGNLSVNKRASGESSYDSSGSFDSYDEENDGDELGPLHSELSAGKVKGRTLPHRQLQTKPQSPSRPRSCSYNDEASKMIPIAQTKRHIEEMKEVS